MSSHQFPMLTRLSKRAIDAATPGPRDHFLWDQTVKGFGAKITPDGAKIFVLQHRCKGRPRRYTIGRHGLPWTGDEARTAAVRLLAEMVRGEPGRLLDRQVCGLQHRDMTADPHTAANSDPGVLIGSALQNPMRH